MSRPVYRQAHASVRFFAPELNPADVTRALLLPPDHQHQAGEPRLSWTTKRVLARGAPYSSGLWSMSSKGRVDGARLGTHLEWLLDQLEPRASELAQLRSNGINADLFCYSAGSTRVAPPIPTRLRVRAAALVLPIEIDHYEIDPGDED